MKRSFSIFGTAFFTLLLLTQSANGQVTQSLYNDAILAFKSEEFSNAESKFQLLVEKDEARADAHYMLARIYFETPLKDYGKARKSLGRALKYDPGNLEYLVAEIEQLRTEGSNFLVDRLRDAKRQSIANRILKVDPENAVAHEELGILAIHDYWRYRNAISLPTIGLRNEIFRREQSQRMEAADTESGEADGNDDQTEGVEIEEALAVQQESFNYVNSANQMEMEFDDTFDIDRLRKQGIPIQDLSARGDRAYDKATFHLKKALESDSRRLSAYRHLMKVYALNDSMEDAQDMLNTMYVFYPDEPILWMYLGYSHYKQGRMDASAKSYETALNAFGEETRRAFENLELFLKNDDEKGAYGEEPISFASKFWTSKDPRYLTPYNERKLEHYSRLVYADLLYGAPALKKKGWETQRGRIVVRYGPPKVDLVLTGGFEAILDQVFAGGIRDNITEQTDDNNTGISQNQFQTSKFDRQVLENNTFNIWDYGEFRFIFEDPFRNNEYRLYSPSADKFLSQGNVKDYDYVLKAEETYRKTPEVYEYEAPGRQVQIPYLVKTFKGEGGTDVYVHYGIPVNDYDPEQAQLDVNISTGSFLISEDREILVERRRKIYGLKTSQIAKFEEANLWTDTQKMLAPPGKHQVSVEFETDGAGTVAVQRRDVVVPDYSEGKLAVSDVILSYAINETEDGKPLGPSDIVRHGFSISPAPWSVVEGDDPIYLYFETYNLEMSAGKSSYEVEAVLAPKDLSTGVKKVFKNIFGKEKGVSVQYEREGSVANENEFLIMDASEQAPGLYSITLKVTDRLTGKTVESDQDIFIE